MSRIQFDFGALRLLPGELALLGVKRPLLVTDPGVRSAGLVERVLATLDGVRVGGSAGIGEIAPVVAIPTTAGTGAEVGRAATLTLSSGRKIACVSPRLIPRAAICDPELTLSLPPMMTAATGMDAHSHGIESYLSTSVNPPAA